MVVPKTTDFQFITSINTVARDDETRRKVRSHARRQKLSGENSGSSASQSARKSSTTQQERTSKFRVKPSVPQHEGSSRTAKPTGGRKDGSNSPNSTIIRLSGPGSDPKRNGKLEPTMVSKELALVVAKELPSFPMLSIETTPLTETLLKYCFTVCLCPKETIVSKWFDRAGAPTYMMTYYSGFLANAFAMNPTGNFFDALHVDTAISHAFMALVASMHNTLARWDDTSTFDFHRFQAIKAVNERLNVEGKTPGLPISDGIVLAVALLVNNETFTGSIEAAGAHMCGLQRIVDLRGGIIEGFKYNSVVQRVLVWADFSYASVAGQPLMFPLVPDIASPLSLRDRFRDRSIRVNRRSFGRTDLVISEMEIVEILELLHSISRCLASFDYNDLASMSEERVQLGDSIYLAERRLFELEELFRNPRGGAGHHSSIDLSIALAYASHLFVHLALRGQPTNAARHRVLVESLVGSLYVILSALSLMHDPEPYGSPHSPRSGASPSNSAPYSAATNIPNATLSSVVDVARTSLDELHKDLLLWILFVGACVRLPVAPRHFQGDHLDDNHQFFIAALQGYCLQRSIFDKDTLIAKLRGTVWLDNWCDVQLDIMWPELGLSSLPSPASERTRS